ncbi:Protein of unknown function [Pyronema omphalodes CBS 100304]|uniref:Uncharacterized protein n=1 Tax=Pyronema omphalodes (strain CBS 100304) TaxID=1076935 RepID=U4KU81_PYROM|nr:Protein of unknown function [Pyronema omphalodes CBS 100304]
MVISSSRISIAVWKRGESLDSICFVWLNLC